MKLFLRLENLIFSLFLLQSCQFVTAQSEGELTFETKNHWDYAARVAPPGLMEQVLKDNLDPRSDWVGDPKRFKVLKINALGQKTPLYFIDPTIDYKCPEDKGCDLDLLRLYYPFCGATGGCSYFVYIKENETYRPVFQQLIWRMGDDDFLKVSRQQKDGLPICFELVGFDYDRRSQGLPEVQDNQVHFSQYCYNGQKYVLTKFYSQIRASN